MIVHMLVSTMYITRNDLIGRKWGNLGLLMNFDILKLHIHQLLNQLFK
jgi:hypothetical protein